MALTFGFTGMDPSTEAALRAAFEGANARLGKPFVLVPEGQADHVVVDMDSMYGPMSWLRLHGAGKKVIGLTSAPRTQTDFRLPQPFDADSLADVLSRVAADAGAAAGIPSGMTPAPRPQDALPEERAPARTPAQPKAVAANAPTDPVEAPTAVEPPSAAAGRTVPAAPTIEPAAPAAPVEPVSLADWLASGRMPARARIERGGQVLLVDTSARQYIGPPALKPLVPAVSGSFNASDFVAVDDASWAREAAALGAAQPLGRLLWFAALQAGGGALMPGFDADGRYRMLKWPQTEREFPKHFRIATAMMKGPATLPEIAEASGVPLADVTDFVNANLATGFAEPYREPEPEPEAPKSTSLFDRLRGR